MREVEIGKLSQKRDYYNLWHLAGSSSYPLASSFLYFLGKILLLLSSSFSSFHSILTRNNHHLASFQARFNLLIGDHAPCGPFETFLPPTCNDRQLLHHFSSSELHCLSTVFHQCLFVNCQHDHSDF